MVTHIWIEAEDSDLMQVVKDLDKVQKKFASMVEGGEKGDGELSEEIYMRVGSVFRGRRVYQFERNTVGLALGVNGSSNFEI